MYIVKTIQDKKDIETCNLFHIDKYNWSGKYKPKTYGYMGYIPNIGFFIKMICEEANPIGTYTTPNDPVYLDSAMEVFLQFPKDIHNYSETPYMNFEINSLGTMLAAHGTSKLSRSCFPQEWMEACECKSTIYDSHWNIELTVPHSLIALVYRNYPSHAFSGKYKQGYSAVNDRFRCNFYKIKESPGLTHFGSYSFIESETPDFHLPEYFKVAKVVG